MPRPKLKRRINNPPLMEGFKPFGVPIANLDPVTMLFEEYEAIRLTDYEGLTQEQSAEHMSISRPTFTRIYEKARRTIANAFVEGKVILIEGGSFKTNDYWYRCENCMKLCVCKKETKKCSYCNSCSLKKLNKPQSHN